MELDHYQKLKSLFSRLFMTLKPKLPETKLAEVKHYVDNVEFEIALEELGGVFLATKVVVSQDEIEIINELTTLMDMQDNEMVKVLRDRAKSK